MDPLRAIVDPYMMCFKYVLADAGDQHDGFWICEAIHQSSGVMR